MCCKRWMTGEEFWKVEEGKKRFSATILCKVMADTSLNIVAKSETEECVSGNDFFRIGA